MTNEELQTITATVVEELKNSGTDVNKTTVASSLNSVGYVLGIDSGNAMVRVTPGLLNQQESENLALIDTETERATTAEAALQAGLDTEIERATTAEKTLRTSLNQAILSSHDNILRQDFGTFTMKAANTYYFDTDIRKGDSVKLTISTPSTGYIVTFGYVKDGVSTAFKQFAAEIQTTTWTATVDFTRLYVWFPSTATAGESSLELEISRKDFSPAVNRILFNGVIDFDFKNNVVKIPSGRLVYGKRSVLTAAQELDISSVTSSQYYTLYFDLDAGVYGFYRTPLLEEVFTYNMLVIGSFYPATPSVFGISTYKVNGELCRGVSDSQLAAASMADVDVSDGFVVGTYSGVGTVGEVISLTKTSNSAWRCAMFNVVAGDVFTITGTGGENGRLFVVTDEDDVLVSIAALGVTKTDYVLNIEKAGKLYVNFNNVYTWAITKRLNAYETLNAKIDTETERATTAEAALQAGLDGVFNNVRCGVYELSRTLAYKAGATYKILCNGVTGFRYTVSVDSEGEGYQISILRITESGGLVDIYQTTKSEGVTVSYSYTPSTKVYGFAVYFGTAATAGSATVTITATAVEITQRLFQFGKTCNCDYRAESIPAVQTGTEGERLIYLYGLYEALMAAYPKYITKVECDTVVTAAGIERPEYMTDYPIWMYKFTPGYTPNSSVISNYTTAARRLKVFIVSGTHPEYVAIWDLYHTMRLICEEWESDSNLEELRWNCEFYVMPCSGPYGVEHAQRTNYNGVDLNRNAPTEGWAVQGVLGDNTYSGEEAASEYETKVLVYYMEQIKPDVFIDHHNTNTGSGESLGDNKNMMYVTSKRMECVDIAAAHISQMTRRWKARSQTEDELFAGVFPSNNDDPVTMYGFAQKTVDNGTRGVYACEQGAWGFTYESNAGILYKNGVLSYENRQENTPLVATCATEGFVNFLVRTLKTISERGINE